MNKGKGRKDSGKGSGAARTESYSGSHGGNSVKNARPRSRDSSEEKDFSLPVLKMIDKNRNLHCYSAVLSRSGEEAISMEDVDRLQGELETLLSSVADRRRTLQAELAALTGAPEDRYIARAHSQEKRRKLNDSRSSKSLKDLSKIRESIKIEQSSVHSSENETDNSTEHPIAAKESAGSADGLIPKIEAPPDPPLPENDLPNRFWASVEPYCADITQDSIKTLEDMIAACSDDMSGIKIPPLGEHYTLRWAQEEMSEERDAAAGRRPGPPTHSDTAKAILKQTNTNSRDRTTGPFTQRLVSALMEENFTSPLSDSCNNYKLDDEYFSKLPLYHTTACFERRLRKELEVIGLVDPKEEETDQIYEELIKCEDELRTVAARNKDLLEKVLVQAQRELQRQEVRTKIRGVDQEILDIYKRVNAAKLKKIQVSRKLKEMAWKALKDRESLYKNLALL